MKAQEQAQLIPHFTQELSRLSEILFKKSFFELDPTSLKKRTVKSSVKEDPTHPASRS